MCYEMLKKAQSCRLMLENIATVNNKKKKGKLEEVVAENDVLRKEIGTVEYFYVNTISSSLDYIIFIDAINFIISTSLNRFQFL